jgi:prepilin-type N-terminal cleavage/methylation domain-containing protein
MEIRKPFLIGLGLFGLVLIAGVIVNQRSFNQHAETYARALGQTTSWDDQFSDLMTVQGQVKGVVESVSQMNANSIEDSISNLPTASDSRLNAGIEQIALAAMKAADSLRRKDSIEAERQAQIVTRISTSLAPVFTELEQRMGDARQKSEAMRTDAFEGMSRGEGIEISFMLTFVMGLLGFLGFSTRRALDWLGRQPIPELVTPPARRLSASRGFSLVELLMVVAITLVLSTIAIANIAAVVSSNRVRAGISSVSGLLQNTRMLAVQKNKTMTAHMTTLTRGTLVGYVKDATDSSELDGDDTQVQWEAPVIRLSAPTGESAPTELDSDVLGYTPQPTDISFNSRGLPCSYSGGNCTNAGFLYYFKDTSRQGSKGWAALSVSPAGKIKKWFWNGSRWSD